MKLKKFDYEMKDNAKTNRASKIIIAIVAVIACFVIYKTYAIFQVSSTSSNIIKGVVGNFNKPTIVSGDINTIGSEVCFGDQCFYVIGDDEEDSKNVKLLAKYNLLVGYKDGKVETESFTSSDEGYNLQSSEAKGLVSGASTYVGTVPFSSTSYWSSGGLKPEYGTSYPAYVYDDNSSIKVYVDEYQNKLEEMGASIEEARLIKQEELVSLGCDEMTKYTCVTDIVTNNNREWVYSTSYWVGSAYGRLGIWKVDSNGEFYDNGAVDPSTFGVRPVIIVPKSLFYKPTIVGEGTVDDIGTEIAIGDEHFYVISSDTDSVTMLAKYNLLVGSVYNSSFEKISEFSSSDEGYNLQSSEAKGKISGTSNYIGTIPFSSINYWELGGLKSQYGSEYPAYVYDDNTPIKVYVDEYKNKLEDMGAMIEAARLIKQEELVALGCNSSNYTCITDTVTNNNREWIYSTTYWSGSARAALTVWRVSSDGKFGSFDFDYAYCSGVRPVIVVSKSIFN